MNSNDRLLHMIGQLFSQVAHLQAEVDRLTEENKTLSKAPSDENI